MRKDSSVLGFFVGLIAPIMAYVMQTYSTVQQSLFVDKPIALYVIAAVINLIIIRFSFTGGKEQFGKGVVLSTFIAMLVLIFVTKLKI